MGKVDISLLPFRILPFGAGLPVFYLYFQVTTDHLKRRVVIFGSGPLHLCIAKSYMAK